LLIHITDPRAIRRTERNIIMHANRTKIAVVAGILGLAALFGSAASSAVGTVAGAVPHGAVHSVPQIMPEP
jgi:hypothetical protein